MTASPHRRQIIHYKSLMTNMLAPKMAKLLVDFIYNGPAVVTEVNSVFSCFAFARLQRKPHAYAAGT